MWIHHGYIHVWTLNKRYSDPKPAIFLHYTRSSSCMCQLWNTTAFSQFVEDGEAGAHRRIDMTLSVGDNQISCRRANLIQKECAISIAADTRLPVYWQDLGVPAQVHYVPVARAQWHPIFHGLPGLALYDFCRVAYSRVQGVSAPLVKAQAGWRSLVHTLALVRGQQG